MNNKGIIGAIIGDIVGSRFEFNNYRSTDFEFLNDTFHTLTITLDLVHHL